MSEREMKMIIKAMREKADDLEKMCWEDDKAYGWRDAADFLEQLLANDESAWQDVYEAK